jgi:hypothetical protein
MKKDKVKNSYIDIYGHTCNDLKIGKNKDDDVLVISEEGSNYAILLHEKAIDEFIETLKRFK